MNSGTCVFIITLIITFVVQIALPVYLINLIGKTIRKYRGTISKRYYRLLLAFIFIEGLFIIMGINNIIALFFIKDVFNITALF